MKEFSAQFSQTRSTPRRMSAGKQAHPHEASLICSRMSSDSSTSDGTTATFYETPETRSVASSHGTSLPAGRSVRAPQKQSFRFHGRRRLDVDATDAKEIHRYFGSACGKQGPSFFCQEMNGRSWCWTQFCSSQTRKFAGIWRANAQRQIIVWFLPSQATRVAFVNSLPILTSMSPARLFFWAEGWCTNAAYVELGMAGRRNEERHIFSDHTVHWLSDFPNSNEDGGDWRAGLQNIVVLFEWLRCPMKYQW